MTASFLAGRGNRRNVKEKLQEFDTTAVLQSTHTQVDGFCGLHFCTLGYYDNFLWPYIDPYTFQILRTQSNVRKTVIALAFHVTELLQS